MALFVLAVLATDAVSASAGVGPAPESNAFIPAT